MGGVLAFVLSPAGKVILAAMAFFVWLGFHDTKVADRARAECQAAQLEKTLAEMKRQRDAAVQATNAAERQSKKTEAELMELEKTRDEIVASLQDAGKSSCRIPRAALDRLRNIR
jgi:septal ring factor EnvC (AmiA/AmiB activator)